MDKSTDKEIIWAYQYAKKTESEGTTLVTYRIWRDRNPDIFPGMNPKKLSNQRRFILRENKLTESEINEIISNAASKVLECKIDDDPTKYFERHVPDTFEHLIVVIWARQMWKKLLIWKIKSSQN